MALPLRNRLKLQSDFDQVFANGTKAKVFPLIFHYVPNDMGRPRVAVVLSKKTTGSAVIRNRSRRIIMEMIQPLLPKSCGCDIVITVVSKLDGAKKDNLRDRIVVVFQDIQSACQKQSA